MAAVASVVGTALAALREVTTWWRAGCVVVHVVWCSVLLCGQGYTKGMGDFIGGHRGYVDRWRRIQGPDRQLQDRISGSSSLIVGV